MNVSPAQTQLMSALVEFEMGFTCLASKITPFFHPMVYFGINLLFEWADLDFRGRIPECSGRKSNKDGLTRYGIKSDQDVPPNPQITLFSLLFPAPCTFSAPAVHIPTSFEDRRNLSVKKDSQ